MKYENNFTRTKTEEILIDQANKDTENFLKDKISDQLSQDHIIAISEYIRAVTSNTHLDTIRKFATNLNELNRNIQNDAQKETYHKAFIKELRRLGKDISQLTTKQLQNVQIDINMLKELLGVEKSRKLPFQGNIVDLSEPNRKK